MKRVGIAGASGYAGQEVARLLAHHPHVELVHRMTARPDHVPPLPERPFEPRLEALDATALGELDAVFLCTPHGAAAELARELVQRGSRVVDLSADFRLDDPATYQATYGQPHAAPELLREAVYGLTEHAREAVAGARLVANPGCYPTSVLLPLLPLLSEGLVAGGTPIVCDSKSGVSGAGKTPSERTLFGNVHDNLTAYGVGRHRHVPEIWRHAGTDRIVFVPHLLPVFRGLLSTIYLTPAADAGAGTVLECLRAAYAAEPFVRVYPTGLPDLATVQRTNYCDIGVARAHGLVVVVAAIDNLVKGAAGQAIQNMNAMLDLPEQAGLS